MTLKCVSRSITAFLISYFVYSPAYFAILKVQSSGSCSLPISKTAAMASYPIVCAFSEPIFGVHDMREFQDMLACYVCKVSNTAWSWTSRFIACRVGRAVWNELIPLVIYKRAKIVVHEEPSSRVATYSN